MSKKAIKSIRLPQQNRSKETVEAILEASAQILTKSGSLSCTTNLIAKRAGVSIGGLYQYFSNREEILRALCIREKEKDLQAIQKILVEMPEASIDKLVVELLKTALVRLSDQPRLRQILEYELPTGKPIEAMRAMRTHLSQLLRSKLESYSEFSLPKDIELRIFVLISGIESAFYSAIEEYGENLNRQLLVEETTSLVLNFLCKYNSQTPLT